MKTDFNRDELLDDVLGDAASPAFREELLGRTLEQVQRRRRARRRLRTVSAIAALVVVFALGPRFWNTPKAPETANSFLVHSEPLSPQMMVATDAGSVGTVHSSASSFAFLRTSDNDRAFEVINDNQLLALCAGHAAALVYHGPGQAELVFPDAADQTGFPVR